MAQWDMCRPIKGKVAGSTPGQDTHLTRRVAGQVPGWGYVRGNQGMFPLHIDVSLPLFLPLFPSL